MAKRSNKSSKNKPQFKPIIELVRQFQSLNELAVKDYTPIVDDMVRSHCHDANQIEHTLDRLLSFCGSDAGLALFKKLCRYYWEIDPTAVADYIRMYREMWEPEGEGTTNEQPPSK